MPTIAYFYGIAIRMYLVDHPPPHFFASCSGYPSLLVSLRMARAPLPTTVG